MAASGTISFETRVTVTAPGSVWKSGVEELSTYEVGLSGVSKYMEPIAKFWTACWSAQLPSAPNRFCGNYGKGASVLW